MLKAAYEVSAKATVIFPQLFDEQAKRFFRFQPEPDKLLQMLPSYRNQSTDL